MTTTARQWPLRSSQQPKISWLATLHAVIATDSQRLHGLLHQNNDTAMVFRLFTSNFKCCQTLQGVLHDDDAATNASLIVPSAELPGQSRARSNDVGLSETLFQRQSDSCTSDMQLVRSVLLHRHTRLVLTAVTIFSVGTPGVPTPPAAHRTLSKHGHSGRHHQLTH